MNVSFKKIGVLQKDTSQHLKDVFSLISLHLSSKGVDVIPCGTLEDNKTELTEEIDLLIVIGGDGTLLASARLAAAGGIPIIGINLGRLGFLVDVQPDRLDQLDKILAGEYQVEDRTLIYAEMIKDGEVIASSMAVNEVSVYKWNTPRMIECETYIDGTHVIRQRADGLLVATPTGSTAYALSAGGPIIHPSLRTMMLTPVCPHSLSNRPVVISADQTVEINAVGDTQSSAKVSCDGQVELGALDDATLRITAYDKPLKLLHPTDYDFFDILRAKLKWSGTSVK